MSFKSFCKFNPSKTVPNKRVKQVVRENLSGVHLTMDEILNNEACEQYYANHNKMLDVKQDKIFEKKAELMITKLKSNNLY
jgi:hypothetical protein